MASRSKNAGLESDLSENDTITLYSTVNGTCRVAFKVPQMSVQDFVAGAQLIIVTLRLSDPSAEGHLNNSPVETT